MINDEPAPTGRPAGALGWAGLANLFYWIDERQDLRRPEAAEAVLPVDPASFLGYLDFETAFYDGLRQTLAA
jgi:methyl acetate hydrolase